MSPKIIVIAVAVVIGLSLLVWRQMWPEPTIVSGYLEADEIRVGSRVGGRVKEVSVDEGDELKPGDVIVRLEPFDLNERLAQAKGDLAAAEARYKLLTSGFRKEEVAEAKAQRDEAKAASDEAEAGPREQEISAARDQVSLAEARLKLAEQSYRRVERLAAVNASSDQDLDQVTEELSVARANLQAQQAELNLLLEGTRKEQIARAQAAFAAAEARYNLRKEGYREEEIAEAKAALEASQALVAATQQQIDELQIRSPTDCVVQAIDLEPGDLTVPNTPVATLQETDRIWIRAYIPEKWIGWVKTGQAVVFGVDSFPGMRFPGKIVFISDQAEFTPSNVQTPEERSKQVYRIKVELTGDLASFRPGMAADIYLVEPSAP